MSQLPIGLPKLIASSVVRGSEKGQSHGGVYIIDLADGSVQQRLDWNRGGFNFSGRGGDRGLRGIAFTDEEVFIAASDELFCYTPDFQLKNSYTNPYLQHCHEISLQDNTLILSSTGFDSMLTFDLSTRLFVRGVLVNRDGNNWTAHVFNPRSTGGPARSNALHINMVHLKHSGVFFSGLHTMAMLHLDKKMNIDRICKLPQGTHNAQPLCDGVVFNDNRNDVIRHLSRDGTEQTMPVLRYPRSDLEFVAVDASRIARQAFGRGLCVVGDHYLAGGSSPSTISLYDLRDGQRVGTVNLTMDIRNAIHGLEVWPFE